MARRGGYTVSTKAGEVQVCGGRIGLERAYALAREESAKNLHSMVQSLKDGRALRFYRGEQDGRWE